jgi:hypothetical protein
MMDEVMFISKQPCSRRSGGSRLSDVAGPLNDVCLHANCPHAQLIECCDLNEVDCLLEGSDCAAVIVVCAVPLDGHERDLHGALCGDCEQLWVDAPLRRVLVGEDPSRCIAREQLDGEVRLQDAAQPREAEQPLEDRVLGAVSSFEAGTTADK